MAGFIILLPILLYMVVSLLSIASPKFTLYIGQATADLQYPLQRMVRLISLPFHRFYDFSQLSAWECMVDNPLFVPGAVCIMSSVYFDIQPLVDKGYSATCLSISN